MRLLLGSFVFVICFVFACDLALAAESYESITLAKEHFTQHQFVEGRTVLTARLGTQDLSATERSAILIAMGDFSCQYVGDFKSALKYYQRALNANPDNVDSKDRIEQILNNRKKYTNIDKLVDEIKNRPNWLVNAPGTKAKIDSLKQLIVESPDYYRMAEAYYSIAIYYIAENKLRKAMENFKRAESVKPATSFFIPVRNNYQFARASWIRKTANITSKSVFAFMFILSVILFYTAKPWRWLTLKDIGIFIILLAVLCGSMLAVGNFLSTRYIDSEATQEMISAGEKYMYTSLIGPAFNIYAKFLMYMSAAFLITYVFALGTSVLIRKKTVAVVTNSIAGTLIMASLICTFYLRDCDMKTENSPKLSPNTFFNTSSAMLLTIKGIEPFLLTEPEAFLNPGVSHNTNPPLENWAREHCPFDLPEETTGK